MKKRKIPLQGKGRRFRGDLWLDEKITGRTLNALQMRGIKFPDGWNPRKTPEAGIPTPADAVPARAVCEESGKTGGTARGSAGRASTGASGRQALTHLQHPYWERICT